MDSRQGKPGGYAPPTIERGKYAPARRIALSPALRSVPRLSLIVVVPDYPVVHAERIAQCLSSGREDERDVTIACAGQPNNLDALKRIARTARFLVAPSGTSAEDLRELAMEQTPGDIVTVLNCSDLCLPVDRDHLAAI